MSRTRLLIACALLALLGARAACALDARAQDLWAFVLAGNLDQVKTYLATPGVEINDRYVVGGVYDDPNLLLDDKSLLDMATEAKQWDIATYLVAQGANVNAVQVQGLFQGLTPLHRAANFDTPEIAELLIAHGASINAAQGDIANGLAGATPLHYAASNGSNRTLKILLAHGAVANSVTSGKQSPLEVAGSYSHPEAADLIRTYLDHPPPMGLIDAAQNGDLKAVTRVLTPRTLTQEIQTAFDRAILAGSDRLEERKDILLLLLRRGASAQDRLPLATSPALLEVLLSHSANKPTPNALMAAMLAVACNPIAHERAVIMKLLAGQGARLEDSKAMSRDMLRCALRARDVSLATYLVESGVPADSRDTGGRTLLFDAQDGASIELLLAHGAPANAQDVSNASALENAIVSRHTQAAVALIRGGALQNSPQSLLMHTAARSGQVSVIQALLGQGAAVDARDASGRTPLHWAVYARDYFSAQVLIEAGSEINAVDAEGWSVLHIAASRSLPDHQLASLLDHHANTALRDKQGRLALDLATTDNLRKMLFVTERAWDLPLPAEDEAACREIVQRATTGSLGRIVAFGEPPLLPREPKDNWAFLGKVDHRVQVNLSGRRYVLGSDREPVYLSHSIHGTETVVCEFAGADPTSLRLLTPGERLPMDLATKYEIRP